MDGANENVQLGAGGMGQVFVELAIEMAGVLSALSAPGVAQMVPVIHDSMSVNEVNNAIPKDMENKNVNCRKELENKHKEHNSDRKVNRDMLSQALAYQTLVSAMSGLP